MTKLDEGETGALRDRVAAAWERRELLDDEDLRARGMVLDIDHPVRGKVTVAGWPLRMSKTWP